MISISNEANSGFVITSSSGVIKQVHIHKIKNTSGTVELLEVFKDINLNVYKYIPNNSGYFEFLVSYLNGENVLVDYQISSMLYLTEDDRISISKDITNFDAAPKKNKLKFFSTPNPGVDYLVDVSSGGGGQTPPINDIVPNIEWDSLCVQLGNFSVAVHSSDRINSCDEKRYIFSGYCFGDNKFYYGSSDADSNLISAIANNSTGSFSSCVVSRNRIDLINALERMKEGVKKDVRDVFRF
jgi:hypothetical protein